MKDNKPKSINNPKVIGFIGLNVSDIILYLSRIACHLNQKILVADYADLSDGFPGLTVVPSNSKQSVIQYRDIDFVERRSLSDISDDYQLIILNFSFSVLSEFLNNNRKKDSLEEDILRCNELILSVNLELDAHIKLTRYFINSNIKESLQNLNKSILIKDVIPCKITPVYIKNELMNKIQGIKFCHEIDYDERDYRYKLSSQYDTIFNFPNLSGPLKEFLYYIFLQLGFETKQIQKAYNMAKKGG